MIIILSFNAAFVAWGPKNKHTQRHTCTQRKKKNSFLLWENSNMPKLVWRKLIVSRQNDIWDNI